MKKDSKSTVKGWTEKLISVAGLWKRPPPSGRAEEFSAARWLEKRIALSMASIDEAGEDKALRDALDDYISMKKKYESSIDRYGETKRVMEAFILYLREEQAEDLPAFAGAIEAFLHRVGA